MDEVLMPLLCVVLCRVTYSFKGFERSFEIRSNAMIFFFYKFLYTREVCAPSRNSRRIVVCECTIRILRYSNSSVRKITSFILDILLFAWWWTFVRPPGILGETLIFLHSTFNTRIK